MFSPLARRPKTPDEESETSARLGVIERYIHDVFNVRHNLLASDDAGLRALGYRIVADIETYFADHMDHVALVGHRLAAREDAEGRAMRDYIDGVTASHARIRSVTEAALERACRRR